MIRPAARLSDPFSLQRHGKKSPLRTALAWGFRTRYGPAAFTAGISRGRGAACRASTVAPWCANRLGRHRDRLVGGFRRGGVVESVSRRSTPPRGDASPTRLAGVQLQALDGLVLSLVRHDDKLRPLGARGCRQFAT